MCFTGPIVISESTPVSTDGLVNMTVSQDAAWPKRGRGMNSLPGIFLSLIFIYVFAHADNFTEDWVSRNHDFSYKSLMNT
jgi:hypothetical protein